MEHVQDLLKAWREAQKPELQEYILRARQDVKGMLNEGQPPQEGADYGPWKPQMTGLLQAFIRDEARGVQHELARMLYKQDAKVGLLLEGAVTPYGKPWRDVLAGLREEIEDEEAKRAAAARRAAAERRMRERLARTSGDSMADEIMAMLNEQDLSRTDIYRHYSRNVSAERINDALFVLERLGWARWEMVSSGGGRPREVWFLTPDRV